MATPVAAARENAREKTGEFGTQTHADPGLVIAPAGLSVDDVLASYERVFESEACFSDCGHPDFRNDVRRAAEAINHTIADGALLMLDAYADTTDEDGGVVILEDFRTHMFVTRDFDDVSELTDDEDADYEESARAVISRLLKIRGELHTKLYGTPGDPA